MLPRHVRGRSTPCPELLIDDEEDEPPLVSDAEDDSSWTAAQGHGDDADQDEMIDDVAAWMDALEADEDTACWASFQARVSPEQEQV